MNLWLLDFSSTINEWQEKIFDFVDHITRSPAFPTIATLLLIGIGFWGVAYFSRK